MKLQDQCIDSELLRLPDFTVLCVCKQLPPITTVQMVNRPTGVDEAINFIWNQPDTVLQSSEKQRLSAALAKETDVVARRYFLAPLPEQWVGTLKELLAPTGIFAVCGKLWLHLRFQEAYEHIQCSISAFSVLVMPSF